MTLRLFLMRHGKSDWSVGCDDHARPLNDRGSAVVPVMGRVLSRSGQLPEQILSSTATRALMTAKLFCLGAKLSLSVQSSDLLYKSSVSTVLSAIQQMDSDSSLMLVGHQPIWSDLASVLIGGGALAFPTAAIARIDFDGLSWSDVAPGQGELKWLLQPKFFKNEWGL
jgi:phosphohistidine phosphatase